MTKKEHIEYWKSTAEKDWKAAQNMFKSKDYVWALFTSHLVLEKLCKAHWVKVHESNHPPKIHNLIYLSDNSNLNPNEEQRAIFEKMNAFQIEGRYPDYKNKIYKLCDKKFTDETLKQVKTIQQWLLKAL